MSQELQDWREQTPLVVTRLLALKKDVRNLQDALENVLVNAPSDEEHKQWQLDKLSMPENLRYLTYHPLIHSATKIKNEGSAVGQLAQLLGSELPAGVFSSSNSTPTPITVESGDPRRSPSVNYVTISQNSTPQSWDPRLPNRPATDPRIPTPSAQLPRAPSAADPRKRALNLEEEDSFATKKVATGLPLLPEIRDKEIKDLVFTHRSATSANTTNSGKFGNDSLVFIGQSVLDLCTCLMVTTYFSDRDIPFLNVCKSRVFPTTEIYKWCLDYGLDKQLIRLDSGNSYYDAMVDLFKAYIGGLYQDDRCQLTRTKAFLDALLAPLVAAYEEDVNPPAGPQSQANTRWSAMNTSSTVTPGPYIKGLTRDQKMTLDSMMSLSIEATRPMKERVYLQVSLSFIPQYETYFSDLKFPPRPPCYKVALLINGDVIGIGEAINVKEAGSRAAWCALHLNWNKLDRYRRIAHDVKRKVIQIPAPVTTPIVEQIQNGFLEGGAAPYSVMGY